MNMEDRIKAKIEKDFAPIHFEVVNDSHKHAGHIGDDGSGQTHFSVLVVSDVFENLSRVERQKKVHSSLLEFFDMGLHALSLSLKNPEEYHRI